jgi:DNA-nicking Smr family endonuclease
VSRKREPKGGSATVRRAKKEQHAPEIEESSLFRASVTDVTPLPERNEIPPRKPRAKPVPVQRLHDDSAHADELSDRFLEPREPGTPLSFSREGVQRQKLRQLRRGAQRIEDELDLHGLTVAAARPLLVSFLNECAQRGFTHVRIIHGKGMRSEGGEGVLKGMVASWLAQRHDVLAYHQAPPAEGGSGAVLVLLRRARDEG